MKAPMQMVEWLGMRMEVPSDWEIVRHSVSTDKGHLVFVDRRQQRLQVSWVTVLKRPDLKRAVSDYRARDLAEDAETRFEDLSAAGSWRGFRRFRGRTVLTRAGLYHDGLKRWIEMTLFWPDGVVENLERPVLDGFEASGKNPGSVRLCAFGVDLEAREGWVLDEVDVKPAAVRFRLRRRGATATVRRLGMVESWFKGDIEGFLRDELGSSLSECKAATFNGHDASRAEGREGGRLSRVLHMGKVRRDLAWVCPANHSLFQVTMAGRGSEVREAEEVEVRCCGSGRRTGR